MQLFKKKARSELRPFWSLKSRIDSLHLIVLKELRVLSTGVTITRQILDSAIRHVLKHVTPCTGALGSLDTLMQLRSDLVKWNLCVRCTSHPIFNSSALALVPYRIFS